MEKLDLKSKVESCKRKTIKSFLNLIILNYLEHKPLANGYEIARYIQKKFYILISPGTIYSALYSLERQNFIKGKIVRGKRLYVLEKEGSKNINLTKKSIDAIVSHIFS